jgi:hypothetical protein
VADPGKVSDWQCYAAAHKIYRADTLTNTCQLQACHQYYLPGDSFPVVNEEAA